MLVYNLDFRKGKMPSSLIDLDPLIKILSKFNELDFINFKKVLTSLCFVIVESKLFVSKKCGPTKCMFCILF